MAHSAHNSSDPDIIVADPRLITQSQIASVPAITDLETLIWTLNLHIDSCLSQLSQSHSHKNINQFPCKEVVKQFLYLPLLENESEKKPLWLIGNLDQLLNGVQKFTYTCHYQNVVRK